MHTVHTIVNYERIIVYKMDDFLMNKPHIPILIGMWCMFFAITLSVILNYDDVNSVSPENANFYFSILFFLFVPSVILFVIYLLKNHAIGKKAYFLILSESVFIFFGFLLSAASNVDGNTAAGIVIFTFIPSVFILFWYKNKKRNFNKTDSQAIPKMDKKNKSRLQSVYSSITPPTISFKRKIKIDIPVENISTDKKNSPVLNNLESYFHKSVSELLELSESEFLEFKSTLKWDIRLEKANPLLIGEIIKTIAGFLNNKGGVLIIGYDDDNNVLYGLEKDYPVTSKKSNYDGWQQYFINQVNERLGREINHYFTIESVPHDGKTIARINVSKSPKPVFAKQNQQGGDFFVRIHGQTENLNPEDTNKWIKEHFSN